jgi:uncharacterized protein (TIGR03435 family)
MYYGMMRGANVIGVIFAMSVGTMVLAAPQGAAPSDRPSFTVASIKPNNSQERNMQVQFLPGRLKATNIPLRNLIGEAFRLTTSRVHGGPGWVDSDRFDVEAITPGTATKQETDVMLQSLLADRFGLVIRRESKSISVYALERVRDNGTLGPNLRPAADCVTQADGNGKPVCLTTVRVDSIMATGLTMRVFAAQLSTMVHDAVLDRTSLQGAYDLELTFAPNAGPSAAANRAINADDRPELFTALREQLGLKLVRRDEPSDILVIEHVHRPTPN